MFVVSGSVDPTNTRARMRTPVEVKWHNMAQFDHDFIGGEALSGEMAAPRRTTVTLRWNAEDVMDTFASLLRPGPGYKPIDLPYAPQRWPMAHADHVLMGGARSAIPRAPSTALDSASSCPSAASTSRPPGSATR